MYAMYQLSLESADVNSDYSKSVSQVYMEALQDSIKDAFQGLSLTSMLDFKNRNEALPTWCPNFMHLLPRARFSVEMASSAVGDTTPTGAQEHNHDSSRSYKWQDCIHN
jgi:hypothetical protein